MLRNLKIRRLLGFRHFHSTWPLYIDPKTVEEVRIPMPWGHIAGKRWGNTGGTPILALHGWQDNAGTWDPLMLHLPDNMDVIAIDFPGQGLSSHLPPFINYSTFDVTNILKQIVDHSKWNKFHILAHSGGATIGFRYACIYPEEVASFCGVDYLLYANDNESQIVTHMAATIDNFIALAKRDHKAAKAHKWHEAKKRWVNTPAGSITDASAEILMQRGTSKLSNGDVVFTRDNRVKAGIISLFTVNQWTALIDNYSSDTCLIRGNSSDFFYRRGIRKFPQVLDLIKTKCQLFEFHTIDGKHHFHMDSPEAVARIYMDFLEKSVKNSQ